MQWEHQHQFTLQRCNLLFSSEAFFQMKKPYAITLAMQPFTSCKLGCASNGSIDCKWLLLYLVAEVPSLTLCSWGMVRDTFVPESLVLAGRKLVAAHCKKRPFLFAVFNILVWNSLNLTPDLMKRWTWRRKAISNCQICLEHGILGHWFLFLTVF